MNRDGAPRGLAVLAGLAALLLAFPLAALAVRAPWSRIGDLVADPQVRDAVRVSLLSSLLAVLVSAVLGGPLAWVLARRSFPGRDLLRALATLPMVLPPVVAGVALLLAFGRQGLVGGWLDDAFGVRLPFSFAAVVVAQTFVAMPFLVVTIESGFRATDRRHEEVAATLGASRWTTLRRVTVPAAAPSVAAGLGLCWARALGEFGATITFAGNLPGETQTLPLGVFLLLESDPGAAYLVSLLLLGVSVLVLVLLRGRLVDVRQGRS